MPITFEKSYNPDLVVIIKPHGKVCYDDLKIYIKNIDYYVQEGKEFRCIYDLREVNNVPPNLIHKLIKYTKKLKNIEDINIICSVLLIESISIKNLINMLMNLVEPITPCYVINNVEDINKYLYKEINKISA